MPLILIRHTAVDVQPGTCYGQADVPLREPVQPAFDDVARRLQALLDGWQPHGLSEETNLNPTPSIRWFSSPSSRAWRLASWLAHTFTPSLTPDAQAGEAPVQADPRWMELSFGAWEGRHWDHIPRSESDPWADDVVHRSPPGGETVTQLRQRVARAMADLAPLSMSMEQVVVVVTHAGPIRVALADDARLAAWQDPKTPPPELAFGGLNWMSAQADGAWELGAINV